MAKKHNAQGRSPHGPTYVKLDQWLLKSAAWLSLSVYSRCLYIEIKRRYFGTNNGNISLSHREAQRLLNCSNKPVPAAFRELQEKGFIKARQKGAFKGVPMATTWILTEVPQDLPERHLIPSKEFMSWQPDANDHSKKARHAESGLSARPERAEDGGAGRFERAVSTPRTYREGQNEPIRSTPRAGTYNIPYTLAPDVPSETTPHMVQKGRAA
jgi:hypothetical protein